MSCTRKDDEMTPHIKRPLEKTVWSVLKRQLNGRAVGEQWGLREIISRVLFELNIANFSSKSASVRNTVAGYLNQLYMVGYVRRVRFGVYMRVARIEGQLTSYRLRQEYEDPSAWIIGSDPRRLI